MKKFTKLLILTMKKPLPLLFLLFISAGIYSQGVINPLQYWQSISGSQNAIYKSKIVTDNSNNIYIAGATMNGATSDILLVKYNSSGVQQWIAQYNGGGNGEDVATALCVDTLGNIYITGYETGTALNPTNVDLITIKYNSSGVQQWLTTYDGGCNSYDAGADLAVDNNGNVYVTGKSYNASANTDIVTIKYDPFGTQQWVTRYDHTAHLNDEGVKISARNGSVVVSGIVQINSTDYKYAVFTCEDVTGVQVASIINSTSSTGADQVNDMVQDTSGNIYIAGAIPVAGHGYDYSILKLNPTLNVVWQITYNGNDNLDDIAKALRIDALSNVFVTGYTTSTIGGKNFATIKYNSSGTQQWIQTYNDTLNADDESNALVLDNSANVYVTGYTTTAINHADYYTIKYNGSGTQQWAVNTDGDTHLDDKATGIAIDNTGRIAVTGQSAVTTTTYQYVTSTYLEKNIITPTDFNNESPAGNFLFYKNSGQLVNSSNQAIPDVKFYTNNTSPRYYINNNSYSFVFAHVDTVASTQDTLYRIDLTFDGTTAAGGTVGKTYPLEQKQEYLNYFLPQCPNGITEVQGFQRLITPELYSNIDLEFSSNQNGAKYYFIVKPGGDPTNIQLNYAGTNSFNLDGSTNALTISTSIGSITYDRPTVYQLSATNTIIPITGWTADWQINAVNNKYKFNIGAYDQAKPLIIEVDQGNGTHTTSNCDWVTYNGGSGNDVGQDITTDANGNVYLTGQTESQPFPNIVGGLYGSLSSTSAFDPDAFILKFNNLGVPVWGTYYGAGNGTGGGSGTIGYGIRVNSVGDVYITGTTAGSNLPLAGNSLQGLQDGFIAKFNSAGSILLFSKYIGGNDLDYAKAIAIDGMDNAYIVGYTGSSNGFPIVPKSGSNVYNQANTTATGSYSDAFLIEYDVSNTQLWGTYFGGSGPDDFSSVEIGANNSVIVSGSTLSLTPATSNTNNTPCGVPGAPNYFPDCNGGAGTFNNPYAGTGVDNDAIIVEFNNNGSLKWSTYFGGQGNEDSQNIKNSIAVDPVTPNIIYIIGTTTKQANFPTTGTGYYQTASFSSGRAYIAKFNSRILDWATVFGSGSNTFGWDATVDNSHNVYVVGHNQSSTYASNTCAVPTNPNTEFPKCHPGGVYHQVSYGGGSSDGFLTTFNSSNQLVWSTYFGGNDQDEIHSVSYDGANDRLYFTGTTYSNSGFPIADPATGNYQQNSISGFARDAYIARLCLNPFTTSVSEISNNDGSINIYPNPTSNTLNITLFSPDNNGSVDIELYDVVGNLVLKQKKNTDKSTNNSYVLEVNSLAKGIYVLHVSIKDKYYSAKVIVQ